MTDATVFSKLSDDVVLTIFFKLEDDPRNWARLASVCTKFSSLIHNICFKAKCHNSMPYVLYDLLSDSDGVVPGGWSALYKLAVCCPGLLHAGVLLEYSDFGLERELGPNVNYHKSAKTLPPSSSTSCDGNSSATWSLYDDLYYDTLYDVSESQGGIADVGAVEVEETENCKRRERNRCMRSHLASGIWNLRREQGNKLLASRFRGDCLYISDWPGCVHMEEKRNYMLFRGIFKNFKRTRVWRAINDGNRSKLDLNCAFCGCNETWDLQAAFCLRRFFGYHEDGEPVVRAYVCENGHVSGAWTDLPLYH
ncbi:phytochrome A-associated F-box protein [Euphorbia lathyris]|uniref:phytochrome A-associated F-box protein n=1 Tax=Euphorbia lathyris TaxID=212925 RepID=UPI0033131E36